MGSYKDMYTYVIVLLQQDIQDANAVLDSTSEDLESDRPYLMGKIRGLEHALELLDINQPVK
jgi:hypothetical protein